MRKWDRVVDGRTLLGDPKKQLCWPLRLQVGLLFYSHDDPLATILALCEQAGYRSPEELRRNIALPRAMLAARPGLYGAKVFVGSDPVKRVLKHALVLGLCTATLYDPARPVLWTRASLTRCLDLFAVGDFYADD